MDLDLTSDQDLFLETNEKFLKATWPSAEVRRLIGDAGGFDRAVWGKGAELGWTSMLVPEEFGGGSISGEGVCDLGIIAELLGRFVFAGPVLPCNIVAAALARHPSDQVAKEHLPGIAAGTQIAVWAVEEAGGAKGTGHVVLTPTEGGFRLTGVKAPVQDAHVADILLVTADGPSGPTQLLVPKGAAGLIIEPLGGIDLARRFSRVLLQDVEVPASSVVGVTGAAGDDVEYLWALAVALQCAETVGATDRMYEETLQYVKDRKSFGRPIGSYQALKHRLADMLLWLESAKAVTVAALKAVQYGADASDAASLAKAYVADRCPQILRECLQLHGGIGYTWEHDLHLYLRRIESNGAIYGGLDYHRDRLAAAIGL